MSLALTNLDDRRWADLVEEGRALIPFYSPEWTDHNIHDPGITLIELFAWLAEMDIYRLNRIPDTHLRKFLALVGVHPEQPRPALAALSIRLKQPPAFQLPPTTEFDGIDAFGATIRFRSVNALDVMASWVKSVQFRDETGFHDLSDQFTRVEEIEPFGADPRRGAEFYLGFANPLPINAQATLLMIAQDFVDGENSRKRLSKERPATVLAHHSVRLVWEFLNLQNSWQELKATADAATSEIIDETRALTLNGRVLFKLPVLMGRKAIGKVAEPLYYLRARIVRGAYDAAPSLRHCALNGFFVEQAVRVESLSLGQGDGLPNLRFQLPQAPALQSDFAIFTLEDGRLLEWSNVSDFVASNRADAHFMLDTMRGIIRFGDGERGRVVPNRAPVIVGYDSTRASQGNLNANTITKLADTPHNRSLLAARFEDIKSQIDKINNSLPATGGTDAETLTHASGRAIESVDRTERAVTLADYEALARQTPGTRVARVSARANLHPSFPCLNAQGIITVIALPYLPVDQPTLSEGLRRAIAEYLFPRRIIGSRVEVVGPSYKEVTVQAQVKALAEANKPDVAARVIASLNRFFHPLQGGPDGSGWPFGRDVFRSEVLQVIDDTPGVDHVESLKLATGCGEGQCGNLCLAANELVAAGQHQIEVL